MDIEFLKKEGLWFRSGTANQSTKTSLEGKTKKIKKEPLREQDICSFSNGDYETHLTTKDLLLYRVYGFAPSDAGAGPTGRFVTTEFAESKIDVKVRLALNPQWKNTLLVEELVCVPTGTIIQIGKVAPVVLATGTVLEGGADQIMLPYNWPSDWVMGYREVTAKPQQEYPEYFKERPVDKAKPLKKSAEK